MKMFTGTVGDLAARPRIGADPLGATPFDDEVAAIEIEGDHCPEGGAIGRDVGEVAVLPVDFGRVGLASCGRVVEPPVCRAVDLEIPDAVHHPLIVHVEVPAEHGYDPSGVILFSPLHHISNGGAVLQASR